MRAGNRKEKEQPLTSYVLSINVAYVFTSKRLHWQIEWGEKYQEEQGIGSSKV